MTAIIRTLTILHCLSAAIAQPPNPKPLPLVIPDPNSIATGSNATAPTPLTTDSISCFSRRHPPDLDPLDCRHILEQVILQLPDVFRARTFKHSSYETNDGTYTRSRWHYRSCEVEVYGHRHARQVMSLLVIALAGGQIWEMCVDGLVVPEGGISLIGDASKGFHVIMQAVHEPLSATNSSLSQSPAISVSKRAMRSRSDVESSAESRGVETRHQSRDSSLTLVHPVSATNSTSSVTAAWSHPVHCFDARVAHLQPALSSDCIHLADQVRDNVFNPYVQFTFGFTDAADINLSRPEFQKWWYGQCMVSLRNFDKTQIDTFRFIDVIVTARRINQKCVADRAEMPLGGTASVGALGRLFYVYLGAPVASDSISSGVTLSRRRTGVNSLQR